MIILKATATGSGQVVNWSKFKKGVLVPCSRWNCLLTTVLTDVVTDVIDCAKKMDPTCKIIPLFPNGFTTASFDIAIRGKTFQINCGRRLSRGLFPMNPIAAEFGSNYNVLVTITADTSKLEVKIAKMVRSKYACEIQMDSEQPGGVGAEERTPKL